jgi:hypothetical protein
MRTESTLAAREETGTSSTRLIISVQSPEFDGFSEVWRLLLLSIFSVEITRSIFFMSTVKDTSPFYFRLTLLVVVAFAAAILSYLVFTHARRLKKSKRDKIVHNISSDNARFFAMIENEVLESLKTHS